MGNSLNIFKRENEDLPEIRHYHEFFNHEKKKIFEQNPDSKMLIDSSISKTPICDLTNCMTLMSFSKKKVNWKTNLTEECKALSRLFEWGKILPKELRKFDGNHDEVYIMEINWIANHSTNVPFESNIRNSKVLNCLDYNKKNPIDLKDNRISLGQINVLPTPQESFIISKKYGEDYNFFDSSGDFQNNNEPFSLDDSKIMEDIPEKNNEGSFNSISNSSDLFFIQYPKIVLNYENNTFLLPKTIDLNLSEDLQSTQNNRLIVKSNAFLESKFNLEKTQRSFEHNKDKEKYKSITKTIEKHLNDPKNSLCFIKTKYIRYFQEKYEEFAYKPLDFNSKELKTLEMICDSMMKDLRQFIRLFKDSIYYFYNIKELCLKNHNLSQYFTLDNMINFVLCIFFIDEVYSIVFEIQRKLDFNKEAIFKKNLKKIRDRRPEDFGISDRFCLNQKTKNYFKSFFSKNKPEQFEKNKILEENEEEFKENSTDKLDYNTCEPYAKAIDCIKNIQFLRSPTHKLKAILTSSEMIMECINEFYKKINVKFNKDIDPDDIMTIYIYMISKSPLTTLITHCNLIEKFLTESSLASISGYYFVTLNASIDYIINLKEEVQKIKENPNFNGETEKKLSSLSSNINDQRVLEE